MKSRSPSRLKCSTSCNWWRRVFRSARFSRHDSTSQRKSGEHAELFNGRSWYWRRVSLGLDVAPSPLRLRLRLDERQAARPREDRRRSTESRSVPAAEAGTGESERTLSRCWRLAAVSRYLEATLPVWGSVRLMNSRNDCALHSQMVIPVSFDAPSAAFRGELDTLLELTKAIRLNLLRSFPFLPPDKAASQSVLASAKVCVMGWLSCADLSSCKGRVEAVYR